MKQAFEPLLHGHGFQPVRSARPQTDLSPLRRGDFGSNHLTGWGLANGTPMFCLTTFYFAGSETLSASRMPC